MADVKIYAKDLEKEAEKQIEELSASTAFKNQKIRIMPDAHAGKGCVVGLTTTYSDKIIPNIVGVDISCGVIAYKINNKRQAIDFDKLDSVIRERIPSGMNVRSSEVSTPIKYDSLACYDALKNIDRLKKSIGTLGGGNHFIEVDQDLNGEYWLVIHTGSRNLGKQVCEYYQNIATQTTGYENSIKHLKEKLIEKLKNDGKQELIQYVLDTVNKISNESKIDSELCYVSGRHMENYLHDTTFCNTFAEYNRMTIANEIAAGMGWDYSEVVSSTHNYVDTANKIIRKGAISATDGQKVIIPFNMADGCIIGVGLGNSDYNYSAPHGSGRKMSRSKAKNSLRVKDFKSAMEGIYSTCISSNTLDESPMAYKDSDYILEYIKKTVLVTNTLKSAYNYKAE